MAEVIRMPLLSDTMKEGVIAEWHKKVGDKVASDDVIAEVETDKATMDVMPYIEGVILYIAAKKGEAVPVNGIIAVIGKKGEDYKPLLEKESGKAKEKDSTKEEEKDTIKKEEKNDTTKKEEVKDNKENIKETTVKPSSKDATVIRMPLLSDTMKEGKIVSWMKKEGDSVKSDEAIAEVETDKATMEVLPYVDGTLLHIGVPAGKAAKVNQIIAIVGKKGTDIQALLGEKESERERDGASQKDNVSDKNEGSQPTAKDLSSNQGHAETSLESDDNDRIKASPLARNMAKEKGISLGRISGTGDGGRIIKRDIENYTPEAASVGSKARVALQESYEDIPLSQMRKTVARRLSESKFTAPHFYLHMSIKMDKAIEARVAMNEISPTKISFNDLIIKACAMALRQHPAVNSSYMEDFTRQNNHISIGTAVAIPDGLIVPVIKFADTKSLSQIAEESKILIEKARNKKLQPEEFSGNTFTISNLGMMDIDEFTAIINPPDSCILAVGKIAPQPVVEEGVVVVRQILKLTLSCDHRAVDGAKGAEFLQTLKAFLENPVAMLV